MKVVEGITSKQKVVKRNLKKELFGVNAAEWMHDYNITETHETEHGSNDSSKANLNEHTYNF